MKNSKQGKLITTVGIIILLLIASWIVTLERQNISDWISLLNYHPPAIIQQLAEQDGMKPYTKRVFYVNKPQLDPKDSFASVCPNNSEQSVVLGCYHSDQNGIFLLQVNNSQLYGIEQVTAAYETLHAIYQRLSASDQSKLNNELVSFENNGLHNSTVTAQIANFRKTEPGEVLNEMTSLFGTEVQNLPPSLSAFYAQYFTNRQTLLNYYNDYETAFTSRQQQISSYDSQLTSLNSQITIGERNLKAQLASLNQQQSLLSGERNAGQIALYNQQVGGYNQQVDTYNNLLVGVKSLVDQYNLIVAARNSIALEEQQLVQSISSPNAAQKSVQ